MRWEPSTVIYQIYFTGMDLMTVLALQRFINLFQILKLALSHLTFLSVFFFVFVVFALEYFLPYLTVETPLSCHLLSGRPLY